MNEVVDLLPHRRSVIVAGRRVLGVTVSPAGARRF